ncbi:MAG: ABC transporter substrate-binding protein [Ignavibacteria bacterium]
MKTLVISFIVASFLLFACNENKKIKALKIFYDDIGNKIELTRNPERIISAAPNLTEIIFAIGAGDLLVGRTSFCNYPDEVNKIQIIGDMLHFNFEKIVELKPDLIFLTVEGNTKELYDKLKSLGIQVYVTNPRDLNGILNTISNLGIILNRKQKADSLINSIKKSLNEISAMKFKKRKAIFVVSFSPLIIAGRNTFINEMMEKVNLENIAPENSVSAYPIISREEILDKNPEVIIIPKGNYTLNDILKIYPEWQNLSAIKKQKIIYVDQDLFFRPGPRFIQAIKVLSHELFNYN